MVSNKDNQQIRFFGVQVDKLTTGVNLFVIGFGVIFVAIVVAMVAIAVRCRTKRSVKKKNSLTEEEAGGYTVSLGVLKPNMLNIKRLSDDNSESSDDVLFDTKRRYIVDRVQPKRTSLQSFPSMDGSDSEGVPSVVVSVVTEDNYVSVTIIKAKNLRRSGYSATDKLIPEGVFARIYPRIRALSTDSSQTESDGQSADQSDYFETSLVKSKKSKFIKFDENQTFQISAECFPLRISVYESDKHKVRYNIGHSFLSINTRDNHRTNQIIELDLYSTVYNAKQSSLKNVN